jgi:hypothetical protein
VGHLHQIQVRLVSLTVKPEPASHSRDAVPFNSRAGTQFNTDLLNLDAA